MMRPIFIVFIARLVSVAFANAISNHTLVCIGLQCAMNEQCVIRKFWCDYTACPQMIYCSKSRLESLRGPATCESAVCPNGYKCAYRNDECMWDQGCKQRLARCISNLELAEEPVTCADVNCGKGFQCVLREAQYCPKPPCRLTKSCAYSKDVELWFDKCRQLGCRSEHECFLRKPPEMCATSSCAEVPDCLVSPGSFDSTSSKLCHGWVCPVNQVCSARLEASCNFPSVNCPILRSCSRPLLDLTQRMNIRTTLSDIEKDTFLEEQRRLKQYQKPLNFKQAEIQQYYDDFLPKTGQSWKNSDNAASFPMKLEGVGVSPIMRSASQNGGDSIWVTYLKRRAGAEAVQYWIDKAKSNQDYEGFVEWLDTVEQLLEPDTYRLWLTEVESATANIAEFQAWISSRNLAAHRQAAASSATQRTFPVPIVDRARNLLYSDKSLVLADHRQKAESEGTIRQSPYFKFNEASQLGVGPLTYLKMPFQPQNLSDVAYGVPQDFDEAIKNSWKSWQSFYQLKLPELSKFTGKMADSTDSLKTHQNASMPQMFFMDSRYTTTLKRNDNVVIRNLGTNVGQIEDYKKVQLNLTKLNPNPAASQLMISSTSRDDDQLPNLLIYFPPPLNFFIYYSVGNRNYTANVTLPTDDNDNSKSGIGMRIINSGSYIPEDYDDNPNFYNQTSPIDKQKEFEFIRKIIRELINYWDDEERSFVKSNKFNDNEMENLHGKSVSFASAATDEMKSEGKPTFDNFLEWLLKNGRINLTQLSDLSLSRKSPLVTVKSMNSPSPVDSESNENTTSGKIHVLVNIDKNAEIIKKIFSKNITYNQNDSDSGQYQVVVNLNDYAELQEEDLISQRLIGIASKQLLRNMTGKEKIPKVLWVFPVYGNEENETIINEIKKRSKEKVTTLEDVDAPTVHTDNKDDLHYLPNNPNKNSVNGNVDKIKSADKYGSNTESSNKDSEGEYYDDQDAYDEDNDEQNELNGSIEI